MNDTVRNIKPLGRKSYGSIPHMPGSRLGPGDHKCTEGQKRIATERKRDKHDVIIVQEKLDGSNVGVAKINNEIVPITRAGYKALDSPYEMHHKFHEWVIHHKERFEDVLEDGERICGEWLYQAHGTVYHFTHEPFVAFDIIREEKRLNYAEFSYRVIPYFIRPALVSAGDPVSVEDALAKLGQFGDHGAQESIEGAVWRVERKGIVDFLVKYVRPDKVDGKYLQGDPILNKWIF